MMVKRDDDGNANWMAGQPWWVKAIAILGLPSVLAIVLVVSQDRRADRLEATLSAMSLVQDQHVEIVKGAIVIRGKETQEILVSLHELTLIMQATCFNAARDDTARNRCFLR